MMAFGLFGREFSFLSPWLLLGLLAAAIPVVLHLLSSVRAQEVYFPTLRFLRLSMEKTARRRRLEHWLLLVVRSLLLAMLALAVAEPILKAGSGFWSEQRFPAVIVLDNSFSMSAQSGGVSRFEQARREAGKLLGGDHRPSQAQLLLTNDQAQPAGLTSDLSQLREQLDKAYVSGGKANIVQKLRQAVALLKDQSAPRKAVYLLSDCQKLSFEDISAINEFRQAGLPLMLVDCSSGQVNNVGICDLQVAGRRVVNQRMEVLATLLNSSPNEKLVHVSLMVDGQARGESCPITLAPAGQAGATAVARFELNLTQPGNHFGQVVIEESDDLPADNVRAFALDLADRVPVLLVSGPGREGGLMDSSTLLRLALDPWPGPWSIKLEAAGIAQFDATTLRDKQAVFFADVPSFNIRQVTAIKDFVAGGGTAVFFVGPAVDADKYNTQLIQDVGQHGGLLPLRLDKPVGQVGLSAAAVEAKPNLQHPYLAGLYDTAAEYPPVLVQRYFKLAPGVGNYETIFAGSDGLPLATAKQFGQGRVVLFATTAGMEWNNLARTSLLLSICSRISLEAGQKAGAEQTFFMGANVPIRPAGAAGARGLSVSLPDSKVADLALTADSAGPCATFSQTRLPGIYRWTVPGSLLAGQPVSGAFAVNSDGGECDLSPVDMPALAEALRPAPLFAGHTVEEAQQAAANAAAGSNFWDILLAGVILLLVVESVLANRFRRTADALPAHLNPRLG